MRLELSFLRHGSPPGGPKRRARGLIDPSPAASRELSISGDWFAEPGFALSDDVMELAAPVPAPLEPPPVCGRRGGRPSVAFLASCVFHAAIAALFVAAVDQAVLIEGSDEPAEVMLGTSADDQRAAGEEQQSSDVTNVTLITMLDATPVMTEAAAIEPIEIVQPETVETPVASDAVEAMTPDSARAEPAEQATKAVIKMLQPVAPQASTRTATDPALEILASETLAPIETDNIVQPRPENAPEIAAEPVEPSPSARAETVSPAASGAAESIETVVADAEPKPEQPKAELRPEKPSRKPTAKTSDAKPEKKKAAAKADAKKSEKAAKAGSGGKSKADAKKGVADGSNAGKALTKGKGGKGGAGNAAASNYPGKVVAKLRRSLRGIPRSAVRQAKNDVQVGFTVSANGSVSGVRITRSSGSASLDRAALAVVRRAAPFPAIPADAGRSSWAFAVPLGIAR